MVSLLVERINQLKKKWSEYDDPMTEGEGLLAECVEDAFEAALAVAKRSEEIIDAYCWRPFDDSVPRDKAILAVVDGDVRIMAWGKTSHVPMWGWCLADQGPEEFDLLEYGTQPTAWMPMPVAGQPGDLA